MRTLLSIGFMLIGFIALSPQLIAGECPRGDTIAIPASGESLVFIGKQVPKDGCYVVAVGNSGLKLPMSEDEARDEIIASLPNWMYVALGYSYGDTKCSVFVNKDDYLDSVISMWVDRWRKESMQRGITNTFLGHGTFEVDKTVERLQKGVCIKVKASMPHSFKY